MESINKRTVGGIKMKRLITIILCLITVSALYAYDPSPYKTPKPKDGEVVLIGNLKFKNELPLEGYRKAFCPGIPMKKLSSVYFVSGVDNPFDSKYAGSYTFSSLSKRFYLGHQFYCDEKLESGRAKLTYFIIGLFLNQVSSAMFTLPINAEVIIPEGAKYVYVGTFEYELDYALRPISVRIIDEYDEALKQFQKDYKTSEVFVRGQLSVKE